MITTWSRGIASENMDEAILVDLRQQIRRHPWWHARARIALSLLDRLGIRPPARILDAGCGWGVTLEALEGRGYRTTGLDISRRILEDLDHEDRELIEADLAQPVPDGPQCFDAVLALDLIEHLDDDGATVARLGRLIRPSGIVIVSVPALPEFFTEFDRIQGHRRRYTPETLRAAFEGSGLALQEIFWWGQWLVRALKRQRKHPKSRPRESVAETYGRYLELPPWPGPLVVRLFFAWEERRALARKLEIGTSLFAIASRSPAASDCAMSEA